MTKVCFLNPQGLFEVVLTLRFSQGTGAEGPDEEAEGHRLS